MNSTSEISQSDARRIAIRYWERKRIAYNAALVLPAYLGFVSGGAVSAAVGDAERFGINGICVLFLIYALGANICYAFAYALEFFFSTHPRNSFWFRRGRSVVFVAGTFFAMGLSLLGGRNISILLYARDLRF